MPDPVDERFMARAVRWARKGLGGTYPNPCVGAVLVAGSRVVGAAHSAPTGGAHAEVRAIAQAGDRARGATLYVTLEPCCHTGRTGPCTAAILDAGIRRVVVGLEDPAAHVAGLGLQKLREAGVEVEQGVSGEACAAVHEHYLHHVVHGLPFVTLKAATSLDGRVAVASGDSRWITGDGARRDGHRLRAEHHAIAVGLQTLVVDDPALTVRGVPGVDPIAVLFDTRLTCAEAVTGPRKLLRPGTLVLHGPGVAEDARTAVMAAGAEPIEVARDHHDRVDVGAALAILGQRSIRSLLVEGGGRLIGSFVAAGAWQRIVLYQAPRILGEGATWLAGVAWQTLAEVPALRLASRRQLGPDLRWELRPAGDPREDHRLA